MKILAADTALGACSAAVLDGERVLAHRLEAMERGHAEALAPMVEVLMADAGLAFGALERLAVTVGPGTFTGQRVGLAFLRALRVALKIPLVGVTSLEAMAAQAMAETHCARAAVLHDARRGEVYLGASDESGVRIAPAVMPFADAIALLTGTTGTAELALAGTAAAEASEALNAKGVAARATAIRYPDALWVARLGAKAAEPSGPPAPLYLRPADAKLPAS